MTMDLDRHDLRRSLALDVRLCLAAAAAIFMAILAAAPAAQAETKWKTEMTWGPTHLQAGQKATLSLQVGNVGDTTSSGLPMLAYDLPPGVTFTGNLNSVGWSGCSGTGTSTVICVPGGGASSLAPYTRIFFRHLIELDVAADAPLGLHQITLTTSGGGATEPTIESEPIRISTTPLGFGFDPDGTTAGAYTDEGDDFTQAGGHPFDASADIRFSITQGMTGGVSYAAGGALSDIVTTLPPGFIGDPMAVERCPESLMPGGCPPESQIGILYLYAPEIPDYQVAAVYNMVPPHGQPAQFAFQIPFAGLTRVNPSVRSDGDYGITVTVPGIAEGDTTTHSELVIWGDPSDPRHDAQRCPLPNSVTLTCTGTSALGDASGSAVPRTWTGKSRAFLTMPTNCVDTPVTQLYFNSYNDRVLPLDDLDDPRWSRQAFEHPKHTGCEAVPFDPTIDFEPQVTQADTPTGLDVHLHIPRDKDQDPDGLIQAHLKKTTVTLPEDTAFNASAAQGLAACTTAQIGLTSAPGEVPYRFNNNEPTCPPASKIANAIVTTPLLEEKLRGEVFLAAQDDNPFDATFAIYIVVREPSILVKLPGRVDLSAHNGQITTTFDHNPQLPFSDLELDFFGGPRASLATPQTCGTFTTTTELVPWSAANPDNPSPADVVVSKDAFTVDRAPGGQPCVSSKAQLPFNLGLSAGTQNPIAGAHSPFSIQVTRSDGHQEFDSLDISTPPGLTASLKGMPYCSEPQIAVAVARESGRAEQASPSCPAASQIGSTLVGAGAGTNPLYTPGKVYLSGPYKGYPLSVVAITPAVAGPYDLGNVVVRSALRIDPVTARITAITDPLPKTIEGVPLRIRDIRVDLDRSNWTINPTNCSELAVDVAARGSSGASAAMSNRYQLTGCRNLAFKPSINLHLIGGTKRAAYQGVRAVVRPRPGDANISAAVVRFPRSAFVAQEHLNNVCTRVQFAAEACPKGSIYGRAEAVTPLLDEPLKGTVHLRSSSNLLPDLVADLRGPAHQPIRVEVAIKNDSVKGALRNTVQTAPDAPITYFRLQTFSGKKGLIVNSRNICQGSNAARVTFRAHNGRRSTQSVPVRNARCAKQRKAAKRKAAAAKRKQMAAKRSAQRRG